MKHLKRKIIRFFLGLLGTTDSIVFESNPDLSCNSYAVYRYMMDKGVNKKFKMIWLVRDVQKNNDVQEYNVHFIPKYPRSVAERIKHYVVCFRAKVSVSCNLPLPRYKVNKKQLNLYLDHGSPLKDMLPSNGNKKHSIDCGYYVSQAPFFHKYILDTYDISEDQIVCLGVPRNDQLYCRYDSIRKLVTEVSPFKKAIIWVPTFRSAEGGKRKDSSFEFPIGLPIVYSMEQLAQLNDFLNTKDVLLIIKPHPAQDLNIYNDFSFTNILFLTNEQMIKNGIQTNELLAQTDAMITDYSGIYYDYLLLNRPIAITLDDYKEYKQETGFVFDNLFDILKGEYVYGYNDLISFIDKVASGQDDHIDERKQIKQLVNKYDDACSSKRVYDFISDKLGWDKKE